MPPKRVREAMPVQVYLGAEEQQRLDQLAEHFELTKSEVIRRGLLALERELHDPASHPALRLIGLVDAETGPPLPYDIALEHDRFLADSEEASWSAPPTESVSQPSSSSRPDSKPSRKRRGR